MTSPIGNTAPRTVLQPELARTQTSGGSEGVERARSFSFDSGRIEKGTAREAPEPAPSLKNRIVAFFEGIAKDIGDFFTSRKLSNADGVPKGVKIGADGTVDSRTTMKMNDEAVVKLGGKAGFSAIDLMASTASRFNNADRVIDLPDGRKLALDDRVCRDFGRMDVIIPTANGPYVSSEHGSPAETKLAQTAQNLRDFAGSDKAARILASFTNQYTVRELPNAQAGNGGTCSPQPANSKMPIDVDMPDGSVVHHDRPPQLSSAQFTLSKTPEGNLQIDLHWDTYVTGFRDGDGKSTTKFEGGHGLQQTMTARIVLDAHAATNGETVILDSTPVTVSYRGRIDVDASLAALQ